MAIPQYKKTGLVLSLMAIQTSSLAATEVSEAPVLLPEIHVTEASTVDGSSAQGYRVTKVQRGLLGEGSAQDTPLSIYSVSTELIRNTQATNTTDALKYVPTVYANTGASQITPYFTIRGFSASTWTYNMAVDGMRSFDIYQPMEDKERIEVLSGASSFLYGVTSPAGMINYVTKPPVSKPLREITVGSYDHQLYSQIDLGGPLNQDRDINYRLNVGYADPGDAGIQHQTQEHYVFSGATDWQASTDTKLSIEADKSRRELKYAQALFMTTSAIGIPATPDTAKNWGAPYTGAVDTTSRIGSGIETHLNDIFTLRSKWRYSDVEREYYLNRITFQNSNLDYKWRADTQHKFHTTVKQANLYVDADFATGQAHHKLSLGGSFDDFDAGNNGYRSTTYSTVYPATLTGDPTYPVWSQPASGTSTAQQTRYATLTIADQISLGKYFDVMIGSTRARVQDAATATTAAGVQSTSSYDQHRTTPVASVSFKPIDTVTGYVTYTEGLQQGFTADSTTANAGQVFAPYVSKQSEAGVKSRVANINLTAAYFRISQANQYVDTITRIAHRTVARCIGDGNSLPPERPPNDSH
jgi:iron complex outermembrane recepter protein